MTTEKPNLPSARPNLPVALLFFLSGVAALVYEALWQRRFALVFGSAAPATAAVLAAYFAGLGLGSWLVGRRPIRNPLKLYAALEVGIAVGALLVEAWLAWFDTLPGGASLISKTFLAFLALALPTACMGGTLPALGAFVDQGRQRLGSTAGLLYVVNTAGAALGILLVPFVLMPMLGGRATLAACVLGNLALATGAWMLGRNWAPRPTLAEEAGRPANFPNSESDFDTCATAFLSGFITFVVQVSWNRAFAQVHENSLYSFAVIAAVFIFALALGGQIARMALAKNYHPDKILGGAWGLAAILLVTAPWLFVRETAGLSYIVAANGWWNHSLQLLKLASMVVLPSAILMGVALPIVMEQAGRAAPGARVSRTLGFLLTINLIGAVLGSLMAGFLFPKAFGLWGTIVFMALLCSTRGSLIFPRRNRWFISLLLLLIFISARKPSEKLPLTRVGTERGEKLVALSEGPHGIAAVVERGRSRRLKLNNSYVLGGTMSTGDERMQSHLPLLLHPNPKRVAYMGLGTGISAGGAVFHSPEQVTLLEIVGEVAAAAREHFADANRRILEQPNSRLIVEDARNFLRHTPEKFDVIIGDLVVPWRAGEGALFTVENFAAGKRALAPGGIFCQWLPLFQLSESEFKILLNTFQSVFPEVHLWRGDFSPVEPSLALVGFAEGAGLSDDSLRKRLAQMKPDPANPQLIDAFAVWMNYAGVLNPGALETGLKINSEDRPWIELLAPLNHSGNGQLFVGQPLQTWLQKQTNHSLPPTAAQASRAGHLLADYTLALSSENQPAAKTAYAEMHQIIPSALFQILFPPEK